MLWTAIILFAIAAVGGIALASMRLSQKPLPLWLAIVHGVVGLLGVILLALIVLRFTEATLLVASLIIFLLAGVAGAILFLGYHLQSKLLPVPLVLLHGALAVTAFVLVLIFAF